MMTRPASREARIEELFARLFDVPDEQRSALLGAPEHTDVADAVRQLLAAHDGLDASGSGFLGRLDTGRAGALVDAADAPAPVTAIGRYPVLRPLGRGGMGLVYLARDERLDRLVALKLLPPSRSTDPAAAERLFAEARAASALDHPNIGTVYEIADAGDGRVFIAMAYYQGETLRERMTRGRIPLGEALALATQLADGLAAAHAHGIVHRDIKPENLIVTAGGVLKIVDFGVATSRGGDAGAAELPRGTPAYMSPEQSRGEPVDHRTDIWSAGLVLQEMVTGRRPSISEPLAPATGSGIPPALTALVERCLVPERDRRLDGAAELAEELRALERQPKRRRMTIQLATAAAGAAALVLALLPRGGSPDALSVTISNAAPAIAVLPFEVRGGAELDIWREGMVDLIANNLDGATGLRSIDSRTMLVTWHQEVEHHGAPDLERALALARRTGASYAVFGSVVSNGSDLRLDARIHSLDDARNLGTVRAEGPADSVFALVDRLSAGVLEAVWQGGERPAGELNLARLTTTSLPALKAYLAGERAMRGADLTGAVEAYERAVAADSTFTFAIYRLGLAYGWLGEAVLSRSTLERAMREAHRLPERERLLLRGALDMHAPQAHDLVSTLGVLRTVTQRYPDDPDGWYLLGDITFHQGELLGSGRDESEAAFRKAVELDPGFALAHVHLIDNAVDHRPDSARAAAMLAAYEGLAPGTAIGRDRHIILTLAFGDSAHREDALDTLAGLPEGSFTDFPAFDHPRMWAVGVAAIDARPLPDNLFGRITMIHRMRFLRGMGRVDAVLELMDHPWFVSPGRDGALYHLALGGLSIPRARGREPAQPPLTDTTPGSVLPLIADFYGGAWAMERQDAAGIASAVGRLRSYADRMLAADDSASARFATGLARALEGQDLARRGELDRGYELLLEGQRLATWAVSPSRSAMNEVIRWWIGDVLERMKRPADAARWFASLPEDPPAAERRARLYEQLGDTMKAREAYELVVLAWRDADPALQPRVEAARRALLALTARYSAPSPNTGTSPLGTD